MIDPTLARRAGLSLLGLLSLGDLSTLAPTDGSTPPYAVAALDAVLGAVCLYLVVRALRSAAYPLHVLVSLRVLSAVTALPAFVISDVPAAPRAAAAVVVVLTAAGVLLVGRSRTTVVAR